jgi:hypothetical protein
MVSKENLMLAWFNAHISWWDILILGCVAGILFALSFWPHKGGKHSAEAQEESIEMKLYTSDIQRGTQHWHTLDNPGPDGRVDITPEIHEALMEVGWLPDVTDPSLLKLTPANETLGATEAWSPLAAMGAQDDFIEEEKQDLVPWEFVKRDHYAELEALEDLRWELEFAKLDDILEEQARRCDAAVEAINPGKQLVLVA